VLQQPRRAATARPLMSRFVFLLAGSLFLLSSLAAAGSGSTPVSGWQSEFFGPGLDNIADAAYVWDDGNGEALYVGGRFATAGGDAVQGVGRWDGSAWSALVDESSGETGIPRSLTSGFQSLTIMQGYDGSLYVGTWGTSQNLFRWDGQNWSDPGGELNNSVWAMAEFDDKLIVGGNFSDAGGGSSGIDRLAAFDGDTWSAVDPALPAPFSGEVRALTVFEGDLIVGGTFTDFDGETVNRIVRFDGENWTAMGPAGNEGVDGTVEVFAVFDGDLYAGGSFGEAGGTEVNRIARWNPGDGEWEALGSGTSVGVNGSVEDLKVYDGKLIVGGNFNEAGGLVAQRAAAWDGTDWTSLFAGDEPDIDSRITALAEFEGQLYVTGAFQASDGALLNRVATLGEENWQPLPGPATGLWVLTSTAFVSNSRIEAVIEDNGDLIVAGRFTHAGELEVNHIARWDGETWSAFVDSDGVAGFDDSVNALAMVNGTLYAAGRFEQAGSTPTDYIARWDGTDWQPLGLADALDRRVNALVEYDGMLAVGGNFRDVEGTSANRVALWDGSNWSVLDDGGSEVGVDREVHALVEYEGDLIVAGEFEEAGGEPANYIARWNETNRWSTMGAGFSGSSVELTSLVVHHDELYAGGYFEGSDATVLNNVARWNESDGQWMPLFGPTATGISDIDGDAEVFGLASFHDDLIVMGEFDNAGGIDVNNLARWSSNDEEWQSPVTAVGLFSGQEWAPAIVGLQFGEDLIIGGYFNNVGGVRESGAAAWSLARWVEPIYTVTTTATNGTITSTVDPVVEHGETTTVTGQADAGHYFISVSGCGGIEQTNTDQSITDFTYETGPITEDCTVEAEFAIRTYTVTTTASNGEITSAENPTVEHGDTTTVTGQADDNHYFASVSGCDGTPQTNTDQSITDFTYETDLITEDCSVEAVFAILTYTVSVADIQGEGSADVLNSPVDHGGDAEFEVMPDTGWSLESFAGDTCAPIDNQDGTWTASNIMADCEVTVVFIEDTATGLGVSHNPAIINEAVTYTVTVTGTASAPLDGQVELVSDQEGTICSLDTPDSTSGNAATFTCQHAWTAAGSHQLTATFSASATHADSNGQLTQQIVTDEFIFQDRFESDQ
jgi:trimeric autotransporter adhesin